MGSLEKNSKFNFLLKILINFIGVKYKILKKCDIKKQQSKEESNID